MTPKNFIYPEIKETDYHFGSDQIIGNILRSDGNWRPYTPPSELQRRNGIESSSCYIEAQQHVLATILEEQFEILDQNFSARFNAIFSGATSSGGDPLKAAQSFRDKGLIPDSMLSFSDSIQSWDEFKSFKGGDREMCVEQGKVWRCYWEPSYDIVVKREMEVEVKYKKLKEALKYSPVCVSVAKDYDNGLPKPKGEEDIHLVELIYIDENNTPYVWDTYEPFSKKLAPNYNFEFGMRWTLEKVEDKKIELSILMKTLLAMWNFLTDLRIPVVQPIPPKPEPPPEPVRVIIDPEQPKYMWDITQFARHSVRLICDEEGLDVSQKNTLCATIGAESGWNPKAKRQNFKKDGSLHSTDWGICQWNDYYHGKEITPNEAVNNPEKAVRLMCSYWKRGQQNQWVAYKTGAFAKYL